MDLKEEKINVQGINMNYVKVGSGSHPVLLMPGALGSIWTDFTPQVTNLDKDKFTVIAWDPPGYGKSRPPNRTFSDGFLQRDATLANDLMKTLGYGTFSMIGWCNGGITACLLAATFPDSVRKMILIATNSYILPEELTAYKDASVAKDFMQAIGHEKFYLIGWSDGGMTSLFLAAAYPDSVEKTIVVGANAYILPQELTMYKSIRNIDAWSERMRAPLLSVYGEGYFRSTWASWVDTLGEICEKKKGDICTNYLRDIKCPTLIVQGAKDVLVHEEHPAFLAKNIKNSKVHIFDKGAHNLHLRYPEDFNKLATEFLLGN